MLNVDILDNAMGNKTITIGRDNKCDLVVEDIPQNQKVSGRHATITEVSVEDSSQKQFILEDHSTNGTYVNSQIVHNGTYLIKEGDTITLGRDYLLDWDLVLPFFGVRKTSRKPIGRETELKPQDGINSSFVSAEPVYPDPFPIVNEGLPACPAPQEGTDNNAEKDFVFTGLHWLITIGALIIGLAIGMLI